jgi:hypothetical protein
MAYKNLPGIFENRLDGGLTILPANTNPVVLVLGTAGQGAGDTFTSVTSVSTAAATFGDLGTLTRGLYEVSVAGAQNIALFRIGATVASLKNIGSNPGLVITTDEEGSSAGTDFSLYFESSTKRLQVYRVADGTLVYDNNPAYPSAAVDLNVVSVSGSTTGMAGSIGSPSGPITLAAANGVNGAVYTAGDDGLSMDRMQTYQALYNSYGLLQDQLIDVVVPMNVFLDDLNVMDMNAATVSALGLHSLSSYPAQGSPTDVLGKLFVQEFQGVNYFWWWFPSDPTANVGTQFTTDGGANLFPTGVGSASATTDCFGVALTGENFTEVNFAYQLANFCFQQGNVNQDMTGVVGTLPPPSLSLKDVSNWVGTLPATTQVGTTTVVTTNGTGLLGNKFMSGRVTAGGVPGLVVNGVDGYFNGGFIATDNSNLNGSELSDTNGHLIDIGSYISVVPTYPVLANPSSATSYMANGAPTYGGYYSGLPVASAPTNKILKSVQLSYRINDNKLDLLAGQRYVTFHLKPKGIVISDAPTAARPDSDYQRLSTVRIVKDTVDAVRQVAEPFLGEGMSAAQTAALNTAIDKTLANKVKKGSLTRYNFSLTQTPQQKVLGQASVSLVLVPAFELRQVTVTVALSAV